MAVIPGLGTWRLGGLYASLTNADSYAYIIIPGDPVPTGSVAKAGKALLYTAGNQIFPSTGYSWIGTADTYAGVSDSWKLHKSGVVAKSSAGNELLNPGSTGLQTAFLNSVKTHLQASGADGIFVDTFTNDIAGGGNLGGSYPYDEIANQAAYENAQLAWIQAIGPPLKQLGYYVLVNGAGFIEGDTRWNSAAGPEYWIGRYYPYVSGFLHEYWLQQPANHDALRKVGPEWFNNWDSWVSEVDFCEQRGIDFHGFVRGGPTQLAKARYVRSSLLLYRNRPDTALCWTPETGDNWNSVVALDPGQPLAAQTTLSNGIHKRRYQNATVYTNPQQTDRTIPADDGTTNVGTLIASGDGLFAAATGDTTAPTVPRNVTVGSPTASTLTVSWAASTDDVGVSGYNIYRDSSPTPRGTTDAATLTFVDSGLAPGSSYAYQVTAFDASGNESGLSAAAAGSTTGSTATTFGNQTVGDTTATAPSGEIRVWKATLPQAGTLSKLYAYLAGASSSSYGFPADAVLDNFNRAGPALGASWQNISNLEIKSSTFCGVTAGQTLGSAIYATAHGPDVEGYVTVTTVPTVANGQISLRLRHQVSSLTYYWAKVAVLANGTLSLSIYRNVNGGGDTQIAGPVTVTLAAGDLFGFSAIGTQLTVWKKSGVTVTALLGPVSDSTAALQVSGKTQVLISSDAAFDDFGGGTVSLVGGSSQVFRPAVFDTYGFPQSPVLDDFNRASLGANWQALNMAISGSTVLAPTSASASCHYLLVTPGPDVEGYVKIPTLPAVGETLFMQVRHQISVLTYIMVGFAVTAGPTQSITIYKRISPGSDVQLAQTTTVGITAGDVLGVSAIGSQVTVWRRTGSSTPVAILTATVADPELYIAGKTRLSTIGTTMTMDDFGTATVVEKPGRLRATGSEVNVAVGAPPTWVEMTPAAAAVEAGDYYLGWWAGGTGSQASYYYTTSALANGDTQTVTYSSAGSPPDPYGTSTPTTRGLSVYATITPAAAAGGAGSRRTMTGVGG